MHLVGLALMAVRKQPEASPKWKPSISDAKRLSEGMSKFSTIEIDCHTEKKGAYKKKLYPFEQYAVSLNLVKVQPDGQLAVVSPTGWKELCHTYDLLEWQREKDQEAFLQAYPEQRADY